MAKAKKTAAGKATGSKKTGLKKGAAKKTAAKRPSKAAPKKAASKAAQRENRVQKFVVRCSLEGILGTFTSEGAANNAKEKHFAATGHSVMVIGQQKPND